MHRDPPGAKSKITPRLFYLCPATVLGHLGTQMVDTKVPGQLPEIRYRIQGCLTPVLSSTLTQWGCGAEAAPVTFLGPSLAVTLAVCHQKKGTVRVTQEMGSTETRKLGLP